MGTLAWDTLASAMLVIRSCEIVTDLPPGGSRTYHLVRFGGAGSAGLTLKYLPRYSPDFSPIEPCWSKIKSAPRVVAARTVETLKTALDTAAASVTAEDAKGWLHHCGYGLAN